MGEVDSIKHCEKWLPLKWCSFQEEEMFHEFDFETSKLAFGSRNQASESTQLRVTRCFFFHYYMYLATSTTN